MTRGSVHSRRKRCHRGGRVGLCSSIVVLLVAGGCAGDDGTDSTGTVDTTTTMASTTTTTEATAPDPGEDNVAGFRGVTADTIKVGVTVPDFDALQQAGIGAYQGDAELVFQTFFDIINDAGGIHGRTIEPVYVDFSYTSTESQDEACIELTEDHEIFIVLHGLLAESNLCLTELHDTMVMTDIYQTTDMRERSGGTLWLQLKAADDERSRILVDVVAEAGLLEGRTIGVVAAGVLSEGTEGEIVKETLTQLGLDSTLVITEAPLDDTLAQQEEFRLIAERFETEGVDFVFDVAAGGATAGFSGVGYRPQMALGRDLANIIDGLDDPNPFDGAVSVADRTERQASEDPEFREACVAPILEAHPELEAEFSKVPTSEEQAAGEPNWINPTRLACNMTMLLKELGEIAGGDLTNESLLSALDALGRIELYGYGDASFASADKWDGVDEFYLQTYDASTDTVSVGDPIVVER